MHENDLKIRSGHPGSIFLQWQLHVLPRNPTGITNTRYNEPTISVVLSKRPVAGQLSLRLIAEQSTFASTLQTCSVVHGNCILQALHDKNSYPDFYIHVRVRNK